MAGFYSFGRIKIISRNGIKSAVATAAYHAAIEITNEYDGVTHDHSRKQHVRDTFIRMPATAPERWRDESIPAKERLGEIWNVVEQAHPATNARLARSNYLALPHSLTLEQGLECVDRFIQENCVARGMGVTYSVHDMPGNLHVDMMYLVSEYDKAGKPKEKSKKEYLCRDKAGNEAYMDAESFRKAEGYEKVYKYQKDGERADMTPTEAEKLDGWERINKYPVCRTIKTSGWDEPDLAKKWRKSWEVILNEKFAELGMKDRVDCRSHKERGLSVLPTVHEGWGSDKDEKKAHNQQIKAYNREVGKLYREGAESVERIEAQILDLKDNKQTEESVENHEMEYESNKFILQAIVNSELFSRAITAKFQASLNRLSELMDKILNGYREQIWRRQQTSERGSETIRETEKAAGAVKRNLDDIISSAARRTKEESRQSKDEHKHDDR